MSPPSYHARNWGHSTFPWKCRMSPILLEVAAGAVELVLEALAELGVGLVGDHLLEHGHAVGVAEARQAVRGGGARTDPRGARHGGQADARGLALDRVE